MPLQMVRSRRGWRTAVVCDYCREEITEGKDGNVQWKTSVSMEAVPPEELFFTHKKCCHPFEQQHKALWAAVELQCWPVMLVATLRIDWRAAKRLQTLLTSF